MALIKCRECGKEISTEATACPGCGAPVIPPPRPAPAKKSPPVLKVFAWFVGIVFAIGIIGNYLGSASVKTNLEPSAKPGWPTRPECNVVTHSNAEVAARRDIFAKCMADYDQSPEGKKIVDKIKAEVAETVTPYGKAYYKIYYGSAVNVANMKRDYADNPISADNKYIGLNNPARFVKISGYAVKVIPAEPLELKQANIVFNQSQVNLAWEQYSLLQGSMDGQLLVLRGFPSDQVANLHNGTPITAICTNGGIYKDHESVIDLLELTDCQNLEYANKPDPKYAPTVDAKEIPPANDNGGYPTVPDSKLPVMQEQSVSNTTSGDPYKILSEGDKKLLECAIPKVKTGNYSYNDSMKSFTPLLMACQTEFGLSLNDCRVQGRADQYCVARTSGIFRIAVGAVNGVPNQR